MSIPRKTQIHLELETAGHRARRQAYALGVLIHNAVDVQNRIDVPAYTKELLIEDCYTVVQEIRDLLDEEFTNGHEVKAIERT